MPYLHEIRWAIQENRMQLSSLRFDKEAKDNTIFLTERVMKFRSFIFISYLKEHVSNNRRGLLNLTKTLSLVYRFRLYQRNQLGVPWKVTSIYQLLAISLIYI